MFKKYNTKAQKNITFQAVVLQALTAKRPPDRRLFSTQALDSPDARLGEAEKNPRPNTFHKKGLARQHDRVRTFAISLARGLLIQRAERGSAPWARFAARHCPPHCLSDL